MKLKKAIGTALSLVMLLSALALPASAAGSKFTDVPADAYYADAVAWAVEQNITSGTSETTFSPETLCTKAQILTFIWRAYGSPEPDIEEIRAENHNPFRDLDGTEYYFKAAQWAFTKGMVSGGIDFDGNKPCSRSLAVTFLWKAAGEPMPDEEAGFTDIIRALHDINAISWAVEAGITSGTSATTFSPDATCTRGQIVTFLYRSMAADGQNLGEGGITPHTGEVWDQEFYDTLNDRQKELYESYDDYGREMMKGNMELSREWEKEGYIGSNGHQSTDEERVQSWS